MFIKSFLFWNANVTSIVIGYQFFSEILVVSRSIFIGCHVFLRNSYCEPIFFLKGIRLLIAWIQNNLYKHIPSLMLLSCWIVVVMYSSNIIMASIIVFNDQISIYKTFIHRFPVCLFWRSIRGVVFFDCLYVSCWMWSSFEMIKSEQLCFKTI